MTKDVILSISGLHVEATNEEAANEPIEIVTPASYFFRNGHHYIIYEKSEEGISDVTKNQIKISARKSLELRKSGVNATNMVFEEDKKSEASYQTPFGNILLGVHTTYMEIREGENEIFVSVNYKLDANKEHLSDCELKIHVKSK